MDYFKRTKIAKLIFEDKVSLNQKLIILGWVRTIRISKEVTFIEINDGSCMNNLQAVVQNPETFPAIKRILTGAAIRVEGELVASPAEGQKYELKVSQIDLIGEADQTYPLQKKRHSFEYLREIAHLRPRTNTFGAVNKIRSKLSYAIHKYFQERGFYYIHTPIISTSDCEGAGDMFHITTFDLKKVPMKDGKIDFSEDFFGTEAYLAVSGQLEAEVVALALGDVYTFGPTFRAENSNTSRHASEFWMIEPEMAFCELEDNMEIAADFLKYLFRYAIEECRDEMAFFGQWIDKTIQQTLEQIINSDFEHLPYTEAIKILEKSGENFEFPVKCIGGSQREERYDVLKASMESKGINPEPYSWYFDLRKYGTAPHSGFGLGFERTLMYITGIANIRDILPFPRVPRWAKF
ncbi:MAG: asparagine--tRNA ligase [candidate division Zixibacteria bacterium]|nr:asparagine--tRNA ligase [candidate division Zixibacteria bacterium]